MGRLPGRRTPSLASACLVAFLALLAFASPALTQTLDTRFPGPDGPVNAFLVSGDTLFVGGSFAGFGPVTGGGALLALDTGTLLPGRFPLVDGQVYGAVADGAGGWYICGQFLHVGGIARDNLAHVLADGSVAPWDPGARNSYGQGSTVYPVCLALSGNTVYVGGWFMMIGHTRRVDLAAVDAVTGEVTAWDPDPGAFVNALCVKGDRLYVGGRFHDVAGAHRAYLAAFDLRDHSLVDWAPELSSEVLALEITGHTLYAAGVFTGVNGLSREHLAAFDAQSGELLPWAPQADAVVRTLAARGNEVFVGGDFTVVGGQSRPYVAALDVRTGLATPWAPAVRPGSVSSLALRGDRLYATAGRSVVAFDVKSGSAAWTQGLVGEGQAVSLSGAGLFVGGTFNSVGPRIARTNLAAFDLRTAELLPWSPRVDGPVLALAKCGGATWAGGAFHAAGRAPQRGLAAFDPASGAPLALAPVADSTVRALAVRGDTLFVGGDFAQLGGVARAHSAAVDARTGAVCGWSPGANGTVSCLAVDGDVVYVGGSFTQVGAGGSPVARIGAAAFDATSSALLPWDPQAVHRDDFYNGPESVNAIVAADRIYLGGGFNYLQGQFRPALAAVDPVTGAPDAWAPTPTRYNNHPNVSSLAVADGVAYAGGRFAMIGGQWRYAFGAVDTRTGLATAWVPGLGGEAGALAARDGRLFVGGEFSSLCGLPCGNLAVVLLDEPATTAAHHTAAAPGAAGPTRTLELSCTPNPARDAAVVRFTLPAATDVTLAVFDLAGRRVATPLDRVTLPAGPHAAPLDPRGWRPGVYLCRIEAGGLRATTKLVVVR